ncbi:MAG: FHA domain-containing protein [Candidatus Latescibacteria bacterium]|nr:FHA domain-containing protein [Candidatus Latescibacterota bacterium]
MDEQIGKNEILRQLANRMHANEQEASRWLEATLETLHHAFRQEGIPREEVPKSADPVASSVPVLRPMTSEARASIQEKEEIKLDTFPFRIGRESRIRMVNGKPQLMERRKFQAPPNNEVYLIDMGRRLNVSREHFQIEKNEDGTYTLVDRGSACGTIVGKQSIGGGDQGGNALLKDGDVIVVGTPKSPFVFKFLMSPE